MYLIRRPINLLQISDSNPKSIDQYLQKILHSSERLAMEDSMSTPLAQLWLLFLAPLMLLLLHVAYGCRGSTDGKPKQLPLPPSPPGLPVLGHLLLVGDRPHISFRDLAATTQVRGGGLVLLRLGAVRNLVVSTPRAAQAVLRTHDHAFASRPASRLADDLVYGSSNVAFAPYGDYWRQVRKLVTTHLFTAKKVRSHRHARQDEVRLVVARLQEAAEVDVSETASAFANDVVCRAVCGKFFRAEGRNKLFRELNHTTTALLAGFNVEDYFPWLAKSLGGWFLSNKKARETHRRWDELLEDIISDHERRRTSSKHADSDEQGGSAEDFIDVMLSVQEEYGITRDHIKAVLMDMFEAGNATSSSVLEFAMAELMRKPHLMAKLQTEVREKTPKGQEMVKEEDLAGMAYLKAVVKETLRLHPPAPLLVPHQSMADCEVDGYTIPAGTRVIINSWAIGRDPGSWEEAEEFVPERFMDGGAAADVDFRGNDFQFIPFGSGRRMCPAINFGLATVSIMLANLVYCFDWELPTGMEKEDIDMTEVFGLTVHRKEKLILVPKPYIYESY
ncbi:hypothetical protein BS78_05G151600 [Paspalum vaginatum]|nr:hypothetical protein BS78_05G151600 [Paspalum vaginatum]